MEFKPKLKMLKSDLSSLELISVEQSKNLRTFPRMQRKKKVYDNNERNVRPREHCPFTRLFFLLLVPLREVEGEYTGHRAGFYAKQKPPGQKPVAAGAGMKQAGNTIFFFT